MNHEPATPLPFVANDDGKSFGIYYVTRYGSEGAEGFQRFATISIHNKGQREDAAYIAHAANTYPKLVEALQLIERSDTFKDGTFVEELQSIARKALREIGEGS